MCSAKIAQKIKEKIKKSILLDSWNSHQNTVKNLYFFNPRQYLLVFHKLYNN